MTKSVAVKCLRIDGLKNVNKLKEEILVQFRFKHDNILKLFGFISWQLQEERYICGLVLEDIKCQNLQDLLQLKGSLTTNGQKTLNVVEINWKLRFRIFFQIASGLSYLHGFGGVKKKRYVHMDIKPENVLLTVSMTAKLADFGSLQIINATGTNVACDDLQYTILYAAPELIKNLNVKPQCSMDVYSYAMIGFEIITRTEVFQPIYNLSITIDAIKRGQKPNVNLLKDIESELKTTKNLLDYEIFQTMKNAIEKCWVYIPDKRPAMHDVWKSFVAFSKSENPNVADVKEHVVYLAGLQKTPERQCKRVPLNHCSEYANSAMNNSKVVNNNQSSNIGFDDCGIVPNVQSEVDASSELHSNSLEHMYTETDNSSSMYEKILGESNTLLDNNSIENLSAVGVVQTSFCSDSCIVFLKYCGIPIFLLMLVLVLFIVVFLA